MKKLLNTLYITTPESYLGLDGETVTVKRPDYEDVRVPLHNLEGVVAFGYTGASPALMGALAKRNISLCFLTQYGKFLARVVGESRGNVLLRKEQYRVSDDIRRSLEISKPIISAKLYNSRWILERALRDHNMRISADKIEKASGFLQNSIKAAGEADSMEELRGIEGEGASRYFGVFDELILQHKSDFAPRAGAWIEISARSGILTAYVGRSL